MGLLLLPDFFFSFEETGRGASRRRNKKKKKKFKFFFENDFEFPEEPQLGPEGAEMILERQQFTVMNKM